MLDIKEQDHGLTFKILVQPRSSKNEIKGLHDDALKIRITAPPVDGAANEALVRFLADQLGCARTRIEILRGRTSRRKTVRIRNLPVDTLLDRLLRTHGSIVP